MLLFGRPVELLLVIRVLRCAGRFASMLTIRSRCAVRVLDGRALRLAARRSRLPCIDVFSSLYREFGVAWIVVFAVAVTIVAAICIGRPAHAETPPAPAPAATSVPSSPERRAHDASARLLARRPDAGVPEPNPYVHWLGTVSVGRSLRFNNPYRLADPLGDSAESVSLTPFYLNLGLGASFGAPDGLQHGASFQWSYALAGLPQHVITPGYLAVFTPWRPWLLTGRVGLPIILNPDSGVGAEIAVGGAYLITAGLGVQAELVGNTFYGAATWERSITTIPMLSLQLGLLVDLELLP